MRKILYLFMLLFITVSCEQTLENENETNNFPETNMTGEWTVNAYNDNDIIFGPFTISTQISPENKSVYIKDNGGFWKFQTQAEVVNSEDAFETKSSLNEISSIEAKIKIIDGRVINNDSIYFDIQFEDDKTPYGVNYTIKGHRR